MLIGILGALLLLFVTLATVVGVVIEGDDRRRRMEAVRAVRAYRRRVRWACRRGRWDRPQPCVPLGGKGVRRWRS